MGVLVIDFKLLIENGCPLDHHNLRVATARNGHLDIVKWLTETVFMRRVMLVRLQLRENGLNI